MKVSLISPPTSIIDRYPVGHPLRKAKQVTEPLGLAYMAAMIQDIANVEIIDCIAENLNVYECFTRVFDSDLIGISVVTSNYYTSIKLALAIKKLFPDKTIIFGGIHSSLYPLEVLRNESIDIVVVGEGEYALREIVSGNPLEKVKGIVYKKEGKIIKTSPRPLEKDLDVFPFPARYLLPMKKYKPFLYLREPVNAIISSRGCPFSCTYCCRDISGQSYRVRKAEKVVEEIKVLTRQFGSREIAFQDPIFGLNRKWLKHFCKLLIAEKIDVVWSALTRVNVVNEELLKLMKRSGCWMLYYGIEAGNQRLLNVMKKGTTLNMIKKAIKLTIDAKIKTWGSFMFALPEETPEFAEETLAFAKNLELDFASFHLTTPFRGTELELTYKQYGVMSNNLRDYTQLNPVFVPYAWVGREEELKRFYVRAFRSFYFNIRYILRELYRLNSFEELLMYLKRMDSIF
ncbi:MAG: B12-binding domain-containing radical SAM protein [Proteobacteria bacterium]|nr:B12-binding domain-containing radical SAM protein [Pseudomonadota bacterium]